MGGNGASKGLFTDYSAPTLLQWCSLMPSPCIVPSVAARSAAAPGSNSLVEGNLPQGSGRAQGAAGYNLFLSRRNVTAIATLASAAKQVSGDKAFTGSRSWRATPLFFLLSCPSPNPPPHRSTLTLCAPFPTAFYHGYIYELAGGRLASSGHLALSTLLRETALDAVLSPYTYNPAGRNVTMSLVPHGPFDSAVLHGKLQVVEDDSRTAFCGGPTVDPRCHSDGIVATSTVADTISKAQTNMLTAAFHRLGLYFFDLHDDGWYGRPTRPNTTSAFWSAVARVRARWP